jgi:UDP-hydrolysing UDP-N-acetyl-D-glucosamine 2-epimerase
VKAKLAVATGTRAEFGIFRPLLRAFEARGWPFELYVTGTHLSERHGLTISEIEADGFAVAERVDIELEADTPPAICRSMGLAAERFGALLERRRPDLLFLLGDRYEAFAVAAAAQVTGVPIAHLHGGEVTEGVIDEAFRHSITKMARLHFVSTEEHGRRVVQLGEAPETVFDVGALGLDNVAAVPVVARDALERELGFAFRARNLLVTHHPLTLDLDRSERDFAALLEALDRFPDAGILITAPNADTGGSRIAAMIARFAEARPDRVKVITSLGTARYFGMLRQVDAVVGNSSSGLIEVPAFGIATVNVGDRQKGRVAGPSVVSVAAEADAVAEAIATALSPAFRERIRGAPNPYGGGDTARRICDILAGTSFPLPRQKRFHDLG